MSLTSTIPALLLLATAAPADQESVTQSETTLVRIVADLETAGGADWTGECLDEKARSRWTAQLADGSVVKGRCRAGQRHGRWTVRLTDGNRVASWADSRTTASTESGGSATNSDTSWKKRSTTRANSWTNDAFPVVPGPSEEHSRLRRETHRVTTDPWQAPWRDSAKPPAADG